MVERWLIADLVDDPDNARLHGQRNHDENLESLRTHGQVEPLVIQLSTNRIIAGHDRKACMVELGWTHCDVVRLDIDDVTADQLAIRLNRTGELGTWNLSKLTEKLTSLVELGVGLVGFTEEEMAKFCGEKLSDEMLDESDWPEKTEPDSHSVVVRFVAEDIPTLLKFVGEKKKEFLAGGRAGAKILERIRQVVKA